MRGFGKVLAAVLAGALLAFACAFGEGLEINAEPVEGAAWEMGEIQLNALGAEANDGAGYEPAFDTWQLDAAVKSAAREMNVGDTFRIRVANGALTGCEASKSGIVSIGGVQSDAEGAYVDVRALAACKKLSLSIQLAGAKDARLTATLSITDPFTPTAVAFSADIPRSVPAGASLDLNGLAALTPARATGGLIFRASGAGKVDRNGVLTTTKAGRVNITVTAGGNRKVKAKTQIEVKANKLENLSGKPNAGGFSDIAGGWTLWPVLLEVKKGVLECHFYALNATGAKSTKIIGLEVEVAAGLWRNVVARKRFDQVGAPMADQKYKLIKLKLPITGDMTGMFLPDLQSAGRLYVRVNADSAALRTKNGDFPYIPTRLPAAGGFLVERIELSPARAVLTEGGTLTLTASVLPENAEIAALTWESSDPAVVTVEDGVLTGHARGTAVVTAAATDGGGARAECRVIVSSAGGFVMENGAVTAYYGAGGAVEVPAADDDGRPITAIGEAAFRGCADITSVSLPATVREIGACAFEGCAALKTVRLPNGAGAFGKGAFRDCPALERMTTY